MTDILPIRSFRQHLNQLRTVSAALLLALVCLSAPVSHADAAVMQAPGSRVSMDLPDKFKASPLFAGFMEVISAAAVITLELPSDAYDKVTAGFTAEALGKKGITNVETRKLERSDDYLYVTGEQKHPRAVFEKHILVIRDAKNTAVVTFNVPKGSLANGSIRNEDVLKAFTSAKLEAKAAPSRDLFKLGYLGPFVLTGQPTGTSRIYAVMDDAGPKDTRNIMAIAPSLNRLPIKSIKEFSQYALESLKDNKDLKVTGTKDLRIDNMTGHQITATAKRGTSETPIVIRQLILLPAKGGYFRLLTVTKAADEERLAPEIDKVIASFKATNIGFAE